MENNKASDNQLEEALTHLEAIAAKMEKETLSLAEMLALYKEGTMLSKQCEQMLSAAEKEVLVLEQESDANA